MWHLYGFALLAGVANAIEPGQNATLAKVSGQPMLAGLVCFALAAVCVAVVLVVARRFDRPSAETVAAAPWWVWPGGMLGAAVVLVQLHVSAQIGAAPFLGCVVTAGVTGSILLDHFGLVGFDRHRAGRWRILGGGLMITGVALVALS